MIVRFESADGLSLEVDEPGYSLTPFITRVIHRNLETTVDPASGELPRRKYEYVSVVEGGKALYREVV